MLFLAKYAYPYSVAQLPFVMRSRLPLPPTVVTCKAALNANIVLPDPSVAVVRTSRACGTG